MLPQSLLKLAIGKEVVYMVTFLYFFREKMIELKNGETYNGHLISCDFLMNVTLQDVVCTSKV
jgi:small nuclear ribonucleoprotein (snRNP)-like protein